MDDHQRKNEDLISELTQLRLEKAVDTDLYRTLIEKIDQPVSIIQLIFNEIGDPLDYITLYMNPAAETQLGLKREETIGRRAKEIGPNAEPEWFTRYGEVVKSGISASFERRSSTFNRYFNNQVIPLGNDKIAILFQDITELRVKEEAEKNAIEALRESEEKMRDAAQLVEYQNRKLNAVIQSLPHGLVIYDKNANPIFYNEQSLKGYNKAIENKDIPMPDRVQAMRPKHKEGGSAATEEMPIMRALKGEVVKDLEMSYISKCGERLWVSSSTAPIISDDGEISGAVATYVDITERKRAEEELQDYRLHLEQLVEERTRQVEEAVRQRLDLVESISDCFYSLDGELRFNYVNSAAEEAWGLSRDELIGRKIEEIFPATIDTSLGKFRQVLKEKEPQHYELYSNVIQSWVHISVYPTREGISVFWHDITELKKREAKAQAMHSLHRISTSFISNGNLPVILGEMIELALSITGADMGNIQLLDTEAGVLRIAAYCGFEKPFLDFFAAVDHGTGSCGTAFDRGERVIVADVTNSPIFDGTAVLNVLLEAGVRAVQSTPLISRSGELLGMLSTHYRTPNSTEKIDFQLLDLLARQAAEVIDHKKAQDALRQSEERFAKMFYNSPDIMNMIDMETERYADINQRFTDALGYTREEVIGRTPSELNLIVDKNHYRTKYGDLIKVGAVLNDEITFRTKSGRLMSGLYSTEIINVNSKNLRLTVIKDVTRERAMEAEMARLDRLNLIGEMAASIGHEIRNPMTSVRGFLQMLGSKPEYQGDISFFELMIEELDRANAIITEYLGMAKDKMIDLQANSLDVIITALFPMLMSDANLRGINVYLDLCNPPQIQADAREIRQMIMNMARNGMEAMPGRGTLTIGTRLKEEGAVLYIKDEGHGVNQELIEKLGTPFLTTKDNGTGLGLAVCYSIAARHDARIDCETGPEGTTFYVRFPLQP